MKTLLYILPVLLMACGVQPPEITGDLPPLTKQIECLPKETAMISAHRGTARGTGYAENSIEGLKALIKKGYLMAEIDIARLKDNTHILYHDGVWEDGSTGKGAVAATTWKQAQTFLLKDPQGRFTSHKIPKLSDYLKTAAGKTYLEIDFKSSANYNYVIDQIRKYGMSKHVILISYNKGQAKKLSKLAPDMMISISTQRSHDTEGYSKGQAAAWVGNAITDKTLIARLENANIPILGKIGNQWNESSALNADILVTDYAFKHRPITGLTRRNREDYQTCLDS